MRVLIFSTFSKIFLFLRKIQRDIINVGFDVNSSLFLSDCNETRNFSANFQNILKYQISRKSIQWESSCSMRMDRQTDTVFTKLIVALHNLANAPKNGIHLPCEIINTTVDFTYRSIFYFRVATAPSGEGPPHY